MAIQLALTTQDGVPHPQAYARLDYVQLDYINQQAVLVVQIFDSAFTRKAGNLPVQTNTYTVGPDKFPGLFADSVLLGATSPVRQGYGYLKLLTDFSGGVNI